MEIRADISDLMSKCIGCGRCLDVCTSHAHGGCDPLRVMQGDIGSAKGCLGCGMCNRVCDFTVPKKVMLYASCMANGMEITKAYRETGYNLPPADASGMPVPGYVPEGDAQLMPGCMVAASAPYLEYPTVKVLSYLGISTERFEGGCCTYPVPFRGLTDGERDELKRKACEPLRGRRLYTICSGCSDEMCASGIDSEHVIHVIHDNLDRIRALPGVRMRVAIQTGCGLREHYGKFRDVVEACGCEVMDVQQGCCGKLVPRISQELMAERQASMAGADAVIVGCPSCFARYDQYPDGVPVLYLTELIAMAMGDGSTLPFHRNGLSR